MIHLINPGGGGGAAEETFGHRFFRSEFLDYVREYCAVGEASQETPVLQLMLASGQVLDVSNILELQPGYMVVDVFDDPTDRTCERTHRVYIRYATIYRIDVRSAPSAERPLGFSVKVEPHVSEEVRQVIVPTAEVEDPE